MNTALFTKPLSLFDEIVNEVERINSTRRKRIVLTWPALATLTKLQIEQLEETFGALYVDSTPLVAFVIVEGKALSHE